MKDFRDGDRDLFFLGILNLFWSCLREGFTGGNVRTGAVAWTLGATTGGGDGLLLSLDGLVSAVFVVDVDGGVGTEAGGDVEIGGVMLFADSSFSRFLAGDLSDSSRLWPDLLLPCS